MVRISREDIDKYPEECNISIEGLFGQVFDGKYCIRGYASIENIKKLADVPEYQRSLDSPHINEITKFYAENKGNLFYPEIILGYSLNAQDMQKLQKQEPFTNKTLGVRILKSNIAILKFKQSDMLTILDGNHRLNAYQNGSFTFDEIPFCIVFFPENSHSQQQAIFTNINFKAKPLKLEENLKNIFSNKEISDKKLSEDYGITYLLAKGLIESLKDANYLEVFEKQFESYNEASFKLFEFILSNDEWEKEKYDLLNKVVFVLNDNLHHQLDLGLFIAMVYLANKDETQYKLFKVWVKKYNLDKLTDINPKDLIEIYDNIKKVQSHQIFVSMPFGEVDCDDMFDAIVRVVKKVSKDHKIKIPKPIRVDSLEKSHTYLITDEILAHIENAGYIIADLTHQRQNVYHEIGYAMGYIKGKGLAENVLLIMKKPPNGHENDEEYNVGFNLKAYHQLRYGRLNTFEKQLEEKIKIHFGLK